MPSKNIYQEYFHWLCDMTGSSHPERYSFLLKVLDICLYDPFRFEDGHPIDENYTTSARKLRREFVSQYSVPYDHWGMANVDMFSKVEGRGACTMLELMVVLARDMSNKKCGSRLKVHEFFWELVHNLDLDRYTDDYIACVVPFDNDSTTSLVYDEIVRKIDIFRKGECRKDGIGGFFPIVESPKDARKLSLFAQMEEYMRFVHCC